MKFFGGELFALFTSIFSYILQKDDPESKIILQNRGTKHGLSMVRAHYHLIDFTCLEVGYPKEMYPAKVDEL